MGYSFQIKRISSRAPKKISRGFHIFPRASLKRPKEGPRPFLWKLSRSYGRFLRDGARALRCARLRGTLGRGKEDGGFGARCHSGHSALWETGSMMVWHISNRPWAFIAFSLRRGGALSPPGFPGVDGGCNRICRGRPVCRPVGGSREEGAGGHIGPPLREVGRRSGTNGYWRETTPSPTGRDGARPLQGEREWTDGGVWSPRPTGATLVVCSSGPMYLRHGHRPLRPAGDGGTARRGRRALRVVAGMFHQLPV